MGGILRTLWLCVPSSLRLRVYRALVIIGRRLYGPTDSQRCYRLPFNLYAKVGNMVFMQEANVMRYIEKHTTIPIPSIIDAIPVDTGAFIVMTRMPGKQLGSGLLTMSPQERSLLATDLKNCFDQLRSLPAPSSGPHICGFGGGTFRCFRIDLNTLVHLPPSATCTDSSTNAYT